ncbi:MAG: hypothetical protein Q4P36_05015 [Bowdeniella nasicola]|nr:hypothetical protein [Bowdeniella nasicola]
MNATPSASAQKWVAAILGAVLAVALAWAVALLHDSGCAAAEGDGEAGLEVYLTDAPTDAESVAADLRICADGACVNRSVTLTRDGEDYVGRADVEVERERTYSVQLVTSQFPAETGWEDRGGASGLVDAEQVAGGDACSAPGLSVTFPAGDFVELL